MSNQGDARRRAERDYNAAVRSGADPKDIARLKSAVDAAKAEEARAKSGSGGGVSKAFGW